MKWKNLMDRVPGLPGDPSHIAHVALRTYSLALSLSLGPSLLPFVLSRVAPRSTGSTKYNGRALLKVLRRELGHDGFAFAMTLAIAGGEALNRYFSAEASGEVPAEGSPTAEPRRTLRSLLARLSAAQRTFVANFVSSAISILLIQAGRDRSLRLRNNPPSMDAIPLTVSIPHSLRSGVAVPSPTLDLTLLLLVRAVDSLCQSFVFTRCNNAPEKSTLPTKIPDEMDDVHEEEKQFRRRRLGLTTRIDALVFWACGARIMWCFFYRPARLPRAYVKWIGSLAAVDPRLPEALRAIRTGRWSYIHGSPKESHLLTSLSQDLGYPPAWGDPSALPAFGGRAANVTWTKLGVHNRSGVGGIPCELVHGGITSRFGLDGSCTANAVVRGAYAFAEAMAIYLPVHLLPVLLGRPSSLLQPHKAISVLLGAARSATFLSTFVSSYYFTVCVTRTLAFARLFPSVSHDFWDGPYGCIMAACLTCGSSIWIENGRRRGEMALYVLPRAIRTLLPNSWLRGNRPLARGLERLVFVLSFATLITGAMHKPHSLRGLSKWTAAFILKGPRAGFRKTGDQISN
ncbi:hypothetical protein PC9H_003655 [Pleurotus ostreatus]|uniref:Integral membrane protein n=1 Tax=Pleurotus ostreatus TaxID=5322 RepID=A0A8H7DVH8_PLEOS|nr:uncharacterized protein PC9H_003655 [Pleurotus ostreatus]KAF7436822.1 hypothetical protein PC9H_003655 [Pleurotus ostreatus]